MAERARRALGADSGRTAALLLCAALLFFLYSVVTPLFEASDELWHYPLVEHLAAGGGLPVQRAGQSDADAPWRQEGSQPPLYYAAAALLTAPIDQGNWRELRRINTHADMGVPAPDGNANAILHAPGEDFPWRRAALAAHIARLLSVALSTATVYFALRVGRELFDDAPRQYATAIATAGLPMFAFISGSINNDNAAALFCTMGLWWALRCLRRADFSARAALIAGLITGLGVLSKSSALGLAGLFALAAGLAALRTGAVPGLARALRFVLVMLLATAVIAGWWFVRNLNLYGDWLGWQAFLDVVGRRDQPASLARLWSEREGFVWAWWGVFGTLNVIFASWVYTLLNAMALVACAGGIWGLARRLRHGVRGDDLRRALLCVVWVAVIFVALLRWTALTPASQGRLMFPAIAALSAGLVYGLSRFGRAALTLGVGLLAACALAAPFFVIAPAYARPANGWAARLPIAVGAQFGGGALALVEARQSTDYAHPNDFVVLDVNWELSRALPVNASIFAHLIDENDVIVAQRDMHPGQGVLALGEPPAEPYRWSDRYALRMPRFMDSNRKLRWAVGVYDPASGARMTLPDGGDRAVFSGPYTDSAPSGSIQPRLDYANGISLVKVQGVKTLVSPGALMPVRLAWRANGLAPRDVNMSLQLLDGNTNKIAQTDVPLPATQWTPGVDIQVDVTLKVNADAPPGIYRLLMVLYVPEGEFKKMGASDQNGLFVGEQIVLSAVRVR